MVRNSSKFSLPVRLAAYSRCSCKLEKTQILPDRNDTARCSRGCAEPSRLCSVAPADAPASHGFTPAPLRQQWAPSNGLQHPLSNFGRRHLRRGRRPRLRLTGGAGEPWSGTANICGPCDRRPGSLLFRFLGGDISCINLAIISAASRCLFSTIAAWFTCRILSQASPQGLYARQRFQRYNGNGGNFPAQ